jgi:diaminohydroxyphosphoribosylaminopyrimidine deaminase/5-amino-6-(5-phosphoribosylamino)uracil reductase
MRLALAEARRASGTTFPNPPVGAVVFRGDRVLGRGFTRPAGGPHAEVVALEQARRRHGAAALRGASLAVTLEPCSHFGRTAPCADAILAAGIRRVLVGHRDPHAPVAGRGLRRLRAGGVEVAVGVLAEACRHQHRGFLSWLERGRPWVALKLAATLDGRIATARGESRWITGQRARSQVHALRARADAVMVGSGTAAADAPSLTARRGGRVVRRPVRVVVDARLVVPPRGPLFEDEHPELTWVLCGPHAPASRRRALEGKGVRVLSVRRGGEHVDLRAALRRLAREGLTFVLVEGGGGLGAALLRRGLVDEVHFFVSPTLIGADGRAALAELGVARLSRRPRLEDVRVERLGDDLHVQGRIAGLRP